MSLDPQHDVKVLEIICTCCQMQYFFTFSDQDTTRWSFPRGRACSAKRIFNEDIDQSSPSPILSKDNVLRETVTFLSL